MRPRWNGATIAVLLLLAAGCAPAQTGSAAPPGDGTAAGDSLSEEPVQFTLDADRAVEGSVTFAEGGSLSATSADGTTFTLDVPPFAVATDTVITMTPVSSADGMPENPESVHAVQLGPEGQVFHQPARLTIVPAAPIPVEEQLALVAADDGSGLDLATIDPNEEEMVVLLEHFTVPTLAQYSPASRQAMRTKSAENADARITRQVNDALQAERERQLRGTAEDDYRSPAEILDEVEAEYEQQVLKPLKDNATESCFASKEYVHKVLSWERQRQLTGTAEGSTAVADAVAFAQSRFDECEAEAKRECREANDAAILVDFYLTFFRSVQGADATVSPSLQEEARKVCETEAFRLEFDETGVPVTTGIGAIDVRGHVDGCPTEDGGWTFEGEMTFEYPNSPVSMDPSTGPLTDLVGGQTPERFTLNCGPVTGTSSVTFTDALGNPGAELLWVNNLDETDGPFRIAVIRTEPKCPEPGASGAAQPPASGPELLELLPTEIAGTDAETGVFSGADLLGDMAGAVDPAIGGFVGGLDVDPAEISVAFSFAITASGQDGVIAIGVPGADAGELATTFRSASEDASSVEWESSTVAGKDVLSATDPINEGNTQYVYAADEVLFLVTARTESTAAEVLGALP